MKFQDFIRTLDDYWSGQGCVLTAPLDLEVGAGTFHPATFLRSIGPEPWNAAYLQPCRRPTDGRYGDKTADLRPVFSEFGLIRARVRVELAWFEALADAGAMPELPAPDAEARAWLRRLAEDFDEPAARRVKALEATTNHDVKAVEYYLRERFAEQQLADGDELEIVTLVGGG